MRRLIMWDLITLDGFFEGPKHWDIDFHDAAWGEELERFSAEQLASADMLIFGRVTYQGMAEYWSSGSEQGETADFMNGIPKIVVSRTLETADWNNTRLVKENVVEELTTLKQQPGKDLFVFGSANLSATLMQHGLIDEFRLCIAPVILGSGIPLFKAGLERMKLTLLDARPLQTGGVLLRYQPAYA